MYSLDMYVDMKILMKILLNRTAFKDIGANKRIGGEINDTFVN